MKLPPQNIEAEKSVLGALMIDSTAIIKIADFLQPEDFYKPSHQKIFSAVLELFSKSEPVDILSVSSKIGELEYLTEIIEETPTASHIKHYAKIVKEKKILRDLLNVSSEINEEVFKEKNIENFLDEVEQKIFNISQRSISKKFVFLKDELSSAYERIEKLHQGKEALRGVTTGFEKLDNYLSGLQKSDLIIVGARPSLGKTAFVLDIARQAALKGKVPVGIFSLEMSKDQVVDRLIAADAMVNLWRLRTGKLTDQEMEFEMIQKSLDRLSKAPIYIEDTPSPTVLQIRSLARRLQIEKGLGLLIIDYVQLIQPMGNSNNPVQQYTEISRNLKGLARELDVPVLAVSQLTRAVDQREIRIPRLSDLRETGSWEQDSDVVLFIYRKFFGDSSAAEEEKNLANIIISKHRNGPLGSVEMVFDDQKITFREIDKIHSDEAGED